nr:AMP-dependent synthetase [Rhizobium sp. TCK]
MRLEARLRESARRYPDKVALVAGGCRLSYAELDTRSDHLAAALLKAGVQPGDRVALLLENGIEAPLSFFAAWKAGAVACPLYPSMKSEKLAAIFSSIRPTAVVTQARQILSVQAAIGASGGQPIVINTEAANDAVGDALSFAAMTFGGPTDRPQPRADESELALLIHTSGSTGRPKGVMLTHANVDAACQSIAGYLDNTENDVVLSVLPLSFGYGITQMVTMASVAGRLVLEKSFAFPRTILDRLAEEKATGLPLVPAMATLIAGMKELPDSQFASLRYVTSAAAALPPALSGRLREMMPGTLIFIMYGQTECLRVSYLEPTELARRPTSVGKAIPSTRAYVVGDDGQPCAPGEVGELVVEGPHVMAGYWGDKAGPRQRPAEIKGGRRLRTGDLFRTDADGFLYFVSRKDDIIKTRGEKVSPQEVERVLYALPGIREAAVTGMEDPVFGQVVRAHVALEPGCTLSERDVMRHCASQLEDYMVPKMVEFRDMLPRTTTGKIRMSAEGDLV